MLTGYGGSFPDEASKNAINRHPSPELFQTSVADSEILYEAGDYTHLPAPSLKRLLQQTGLPEEKASI